MNYNMMRSRVKGTEMNRSKKKKKETGKLQYEKIRHEKQTSKQKSLSTLPTNHLTYCFVLVKHDHICPNDTKISINPFIFKGKKMYLIATILHRIHKDCHCYYLIIHLSSTY